MFADIVGYTALMGESEDLAFQVVNKFKDVGALSVQKHNGVWHKDLGDGALCSFENALDAVICAIAIQRQINKRFDFKVRIGIHLGDVTYRDGDVYGDGVNVASRIQSEAAPGGICISESVYKSIRNKEGVDAEYLGKRKLKNVDLTAHLYQVSNSGVLTRSRTSVKVMSMRKATMLAIAVGISVSLFWIWAFSRSQISQTANVERHDIVLPELTPLALIGSATFGVGQKALDLSPSADLLAYVAQKDQTSHLYLRSMDSYDVKKIEGTDGAFFPFFSPNGEWIGFFTSHHLKKVSVRGGLPISICTVSNCTGGGQWLQNDQIIFSDSEGSRLYLIGADGKDKSEIIVEGMSGTISSFLFPRQLSEGIILVASAFPNRIRAISVDQSTSMTLLDHGSSPIYLSSGHLAFMEHGRLMAAPFDPEELTITGEIVSLIEDLRTEDRSMQLTLSGNGDLIYVPGVSAMKNKLIWKRLNDEEEDLVSLRPDYYGECIISPDGTKLAISYHSPFDVAVFDFRNTTTHRLTRDGISYGSKWSSDGQRIFFGRFSDDATKIYHIDASGSGLATHFELDRNWADPVNWSSDGKIFVYMQTDSVQGVDLILHFEENQEDIKLLPDKGNQYLASFSPNNDYLAYTSNETGRSEVHVQTVPPDGNRWIISSNGGEEPVWAPRTNELYYRNGNDWWVVKIEYEPEFQTTVPELLFSGAYLNVPEYSYHIHPDGDRFLLHAPLDTTTTTTRLKLIKGWYEEVKRLAPSE